MWQYTTETIINSNTGNLPGGVRFGVFDGNGGNTAPKQSPFTAKDVLLIDGVNAFKLGNGAAITRISYRKHQPSVDATAELNLANLISPVKIKGADHSLAANDVLRLKVELKETGRVSSIMADALREHRKPFHYEIELTSSEFSGTPPTIVAANVATKLAAVINKEMALTDFKFFKAEVSGNKLVLKALDCYTQFHSIQLDLVAPEAGGVPQLGADTYVSVLDKDNDITVTKGEEGLGNALQLVKNNRIPTHVSTNPFGVDQGGKPVPGGQYDQFVIEYCSDRRFIGHQVLGALDKSVTVHTFWVKAN